MRECTLFHLFECLDPFFVDMSFRYLGNNDWRHADFLNYWSQSLLDSLAVVKSDIEGRRSGLQAFDVGRNVGKIISKAGKVGLDGTENIVASAY